MTKKQIEEVAEKLGWTVEFSINNGNKWICFENCSPSGQDLIVEFSYVNYDQLVDEVEQRYINYDPSYEAYIWLDSDGHGKNGAPYEMGEVYEDMVACQGMIGNLYLALSKKQEK